MLKTGSLISERYEVLGPVGHGDSGTLFDVVDHSIERNRRLVRLLAHLEGPAADARYAALHVLSRLDHRQLPSLHDFVLDESLSCVVMKLGGRKLGDLTTFPAVPGNTRQALTWAGTILDALELLHSQDPPIVHGHVSPDNLAEDGGDICLLCVGVAAGCLHGFGGEAPAAFDSRCAPPEQWRGAPLDPRADLFAVGATLYFHATGEYPPDAKLREMSLGSGKPDPIPDAAALGPGLALEVAAVVLRALALEPADRPASAPEMKAELEAAAVAFRNELRSRFGSWATGFAICDCGFFEGFVHGCSRASFKTLCLFPAYCDDCRSLRLINMLEDPVPTCRSCNGSRVTSYDSDRLRGQPGREVIIRENAAGRSDMRFELTDGSYFCPKCSQFNLTFERTGLIID